MQEAQTLWEALSAFAEQLGAELHIRSWACCLEICLRTFEEEMQLRLHAHLYLMSEVQQLRCEIPKKLRFLFSGPHLKDTMWGKEVDEAIIGRGPTIVWCRSSASFFAMARFGIFVIVQSTLLDFEHGGVGENILRRGQS